ncbi:hypothetical protein RMSM_02559 [Rhodopirellula maiorica SM1]|uniref:Uncharacterized protein n=1 Tax=Rhodopirellula maiorica SM1 TaxID=1265738 RepID=M5RYP9_9BACT|nr:hypothetical protein RMSM_02559 [Rhodopirellula maiorica SM1]
MPFPDRPWLDGLGNRHDGSVALKMSRFATRFFAPEPFAFDLSQSIPTSGVAT